jgi:hypothetical protein
LEVEFEEDIGLFVLLYKKLIRRKRRIGGGGVYPG